jgi:hypothetical protein
MFAKDYFKLSGVITLVKRCTWRSYFAAVLLPLLLMVSLPTFSGPNSDTFVGNTLMQHTNSIPSTGMIGNAPSQHWPGHDFGAIVNESSLDRYLPAAEMPFYYTLYNGTIVPRNSELGPLLGTVDNSLPTRRPGHGLRRFRR